MDRKAKLRRWARIRHARKKQSKTRPWNNDDRALIDGFAAAWKS